MKKRTTFDDEIFGFIQECEPDILWTIIQLLKSWTSKGSKILAKEYETPERISELGSQERCEVAKLVMDEIGFFGSADLAAFWRKLRGKNPYVSYLEILRDVCNLINRMQASSPKVLMIGKWLKYLGIHGKKQYIIPKLGTIVTYEDLLTEMLFLDYMKDLINQKQDDLIKVFKDLGLDDEVITKVLREIGTQNISGFAIVQFIRFLGKRTVKDLILIMLQKIIIRVLGKEAAVKIIGKLATRITQKAMSKFATSILGVVLIIWDIIMIQGPATRKTIPVLSFISAERFIQRKLDDE